MPVYRTFADREEQPRRSVLARRATRGSPAGRIHAAELTADHTLCDRPTRDLVEFGRSRYAYESTPMPDRCPTCNELAGRPTVSG